ncbi:MAG: CHAT domain-containing tetratricopeptide repeat protein [Acidobacteriota bacterium]
MRLGLGERVCRTLSAEASLGVVIASEGEEPLRLAVEQRGIDIEIQVAESREGPGRTIDSPQDRQGEESAWLPQPTSGFAIAIKAREIGAPAGEICMRLETPAADITEAWAAIDRASALYARGDRASWREALAAYREALRAFRAAGDPSGEARALFSLAVVSRLVDEPKAALAQGAEALPLLLETDGKLAAALANEIGLDHLLLGDNDSARTSFQQAEKLAEGNGDPFNQAVAQSNLCRMKQVAGDLIAARACYGAARRALAEAQAPALEAAAWISAGRIEDVLGEPESALSAYRLALALQERVGDELGRARTLNNLGLLEQELGRFDSGIAAYGEALAKFTLLADRRWQARVRNNLGLAYQQVGQPEAAEAQWQTALPLWREAGDAAGEASTSLNLALAVVAAPRAPDAGRAEEAATRIERALALYRAAGDRRGEAVGLSVKAKGQAARGEAEAARSTFAQALERLAAIGDRAQEADAENGLGELELAAGRYAEARPPFERSLALARALGQRRREAKALFGLGRLARAEGDLPLALQSFEDALLGLESERVHLAGAEAQTSFSALATGVSEEVIETALALDRAHPGTGWSARALAQVERSRGRALVELLAQAGVDLEAAVDPARAASRAELSRRLAAKAERAAGNVNDAIRAQLAREAAEISTQLDLLDAQTRAQSPAVGALLDPPALDPQAIAATLDAETLVLVFHLGAERSTLWSLVRGRIESFDFPPRRELERAALELFRSLRRFDPAEREAEEKGLGTLGDRLLGPVTARLTEHRRIVIVTDGALAYLPWAALGVPGTGRPLVAEHEISFVPSLSALAAVRERAASRAPAHGLIAALADPVFATDDPRLAKGFKAAHPPDLSLPIGMTEKETAAIAEGGSQEKIPDRGEPFERLAGSAAEVERIVALAPAATAGDPRRELFGFAAARLALAEGGLADFRVLHFATHGVIDAANPALSGLALSRYTPAGEEIEGFLHLRDIFSLKLGADLVVLSGCETALGEEVRGEGLVGLARGFLYAGASRVVASLWAVDDRAAVAFMENFYRALWRDRLAPAAALAKAQREIAAGRRTRDPAFWAGWVLLGDGD